MADTGRIFQISTTGADIVGFDPARDKLDLGDVSVHNCIVVDTPEGVGFMNPWSGEMAVVVGVSLGQLTIDSFVPVINDHLRQDLSGALAWEQGITPAANTVYARSHEIGQIDRVAFNPATDTVDFRYFGTREQIYMTDSPDGVIISNSGTGQALILLGVTVSQLEVDNFVFHAAQVREDRVHLQLGFGPVPESQVLPQGVPVAGTPDWPTGTGTGAPPTGEVGVTTVIAWNYGSAAVIAFDPAKDKLDFGWFKDHEFSVAEVNGSTIITITGNNQTYTLTGVALHELELNNIIALDNSARTEWQGLINNAVPPVGLPSLSVSDASVAEGQSGTSHMVFTVTLSAASAVPVTVSYTTLNGTATAGQDYASSVGTLTFAPGETVKTVQVPVVGDTVVELNESFTLNLSSPVNATVTDGSAVGTILNDDQDSAPGTLPAISIADLAVNEGDGEHMHFMFVVTLDKASATPVTVQYATMSGTALSGVDFTAASGTVTFAPGETSKMIHVDILADTVQEADETFTVTLSGPSGATIADGTAIGTILNDDHDTPPVAVPAASIADLSVTEGNGDHVHFMFVVTLNAPSTQPVTLRYATSNGTAIAGSDYVAGSGLLTFAPGETSKTIHVDVMGDTLVEANETFTVTLSDPSGVTIADGVAVGTIVNDDVAPVLPTLSVSDASVTEGDAGTKVMTFTVTLSSAATGPVSVAYATANGTATAGSDYVAASGTLTFAAGETTKTIQVTVTGDTAVEANETLVLNLSAPTGATIADGSGTGTITNDDVATPPAGTAGVDYTVRDNWGSGFTADMAVEAGTSALNGWVIEFDAGFTITNIWNAQIVSHVGTHYVIKNLSYNGAVGAGKETSFGFQATPGAGGTAATGFTVNGTPSGGDPTPVLPTLSVSDASVAEGNSGTKVMTFTVTLSSAATGPVSVAYATANGTATAGSDYVAASGTLTFAAGETTKTIQVTVNGDTAVEANESLTLNLSAPSGATIADGSGAGTITNDDVVAPVLPTLSVSDASVAEGNSGTKVMTFTVTLSSAATGPVSVAYATANGTATAGSDYVATSGTLTFAAGETTKTIQVTVNGDTAVEANETLILNLSAPSGATIADGSGTGTITNDDTAPNPGTGGAVEYQVSSNWGSGFTANMTVEAGGAALNGWTVEFDAGFTITNIWNAQIVSHVGTHYVIKNLSYNGAVGAGKETAFGFQASGGTAASGFVLNGSPVSGDPAPVLPSLVVSDASVVEGNAGTSLLAFTVTLSAASATAVSVAYGTSNGTAQAGSDYAALSGSLTFAPGETTKVVYVQVAGDTVVEANETLTLTLSGASGATISDATGIGTILNDDVVLPSLSIADASVTEGHAGTKVMTFTITLSQAATGPVSVAYATGDGTATAGSDYAAGNGTVTFAAGETTKTIQVTVNGDTAVESNETFTVTLSAPTGATITDGSATGTIVNDDVSGTAPVVSISGTTVIEGDPGTGAAAEGWLSTRGNQIVDADGNTVQIAGVNWFGFESSNFAPHGLWTRGYQDMMDQMVDLGFNTIRLPFSSEMLHTSAAPNGIDFSKNPDLQGLSALQIMDKIVDYAAEIGLKIILDHHRSEAGAGTSGNGLWYNGQYSEAAWVSDWQMLAQRYADEPAVIGADLHNEPYNGTWGGGGANDWAAAAERAGNAIGAVNDDWLIFVEGVGTYDGNNYWWGGNLEGVRDRPIELNVDNKLVYSAHDYPNSVYNQPWFQSSDFAAHLPEKFDEMWGYIYREGIAPVYIGEFGTNLTDPKDAPWLEAITSYIAGDFDNDGTIDIPEGDQGISWTFWSWNPNSGDTGGILANDWTTVNTNKMAYLEAIKFDFATDVPDGEGGSAADVTYATFLVTLSAASSEVVTVGYHTMAGTAGDGDFTPSHGTVTFAPGETTKEIKIAVTPDSLDEADESFSVMLMDASGAVIGVGTAQATILNDDTTPTTPTNPGTGGGSGSVEADLEALLNLVDSWGSGFNASVVIHNEGGATNGWQLEIDMPFEITSIWNAEIVSQDDDGYVIRNAAWNGALSADGTVSFGFTGSGAYDASQIDLHL
ncbi:Calx-beta domain-containing protein [Aquabacter cavernae]|uniref:Calx-beta domain-containing protein n=1 Tax=Aquabacter cavernae TaxID=2496029 RepID=UPI00196A3B05|nr:Calx-beta domain-containing protein [Aquabacter cavernae]